MPRKLSIFSCQRVSNTVTNFNRSHDGCAMSINNERAVSLNKVPYCKLHDISIQESLILRLER